MNGWLDIFDVWLHGKREITGFYKEHKESHGKEGKGHQPLEYPVKVGVEADGERVGEFFHDLIGDLHDHDPRDPLVWAGNLHVVQSGIVEGLLVQ